MGIAISSCCLPGKKDTDESINERTRILNDPTDGRLMGDDVYGSTSMIGKESTTYGSINDGSKNDQTTSWHRTLSKMVANVIDVSTIDLPPIEPNESKERSRIYVHRINQLRNPLLLKFRLQNRLHQQANRKLDGLEKENFSTALISDEDRALIGETLDKSLMAIKSGFNINAKEELVVQFNP